MCAAKLNEQDCQYCWQTSQFQVSDAAEKALCTTGCQILPSKTGVEKRFLFEDLTGDNLKKDAAIIAGCSLTHQSSKRFIVDSVGDIAKDAAIIAQCQLK